MDTELTPALERVAASVIETHRRRQQLQDELATATAAVAALQEQSVSLESCVVDLRKQLEASLEAGVREDAALEQLAAKRKQAVGQIDDLVAHVNTFLGEKERASSGLDAQIDSSRVALAAIEEEVRKVKTLFESVTREVASLRNVIGQVRQSADQAETQLEDIGSKVKDLDAAADGMAARVCRIAEAVDHAEKNKQHIATAVDELHKITANLQARKAQAEAAADAVNVLAKDRERNAAALAKQLERLDQLVTGSPAAQNGDTASKLAPTDRHSQSSGALSQPVQATAYGSTLATLDLLASQSLLSSGESSDAVQLLRVGGVDKLVRSWWSRAMASPQPACYRLVIGQALSESGDSKGALTFFNRAMEGKQADPFITYLVARALLDMKRYVDVLRIAAGIGRTKHGRALAQNIEALHLASSRRYDDAESKLAQALALPGLAKLHYRETLYNLGQVAESKGDVRAASAWFEKLYGIDPTYRDIASHIEQRKTPEAVG